MLLLFKVCLIVDVSASSGLTFVLDMVHNNPGETATQTKYTNPKVLKKLGLMEWFLNGMFNVR